MKSIETSGKTAEQAIELGLYKLGVKRDEVKIEILKQATLFDKAVVRISLNTSSEEETKIQELVEKIIAQGLYFPITVSEASRKSHKRLLYRELWHEYNMHRNEIDDEVYCNVCRELIEMLSESSNIRFRITLAELYRNIGEFERCFAILDEVNDESALDGAVERIRSEALKKNKRTVVIKDTRE